MALTDIVFDWYQSNLYDIMSCSLVVDCSVLQGSVLGPLEFEAYTEDIVEVIDKHDMKSPLYADDTQVYTSCQPKYIDVIRSRPSHCVSGVAL